MFMLPTVYDFMETVCPTGDIILDSARNTCTHPTSFWPLLADMILNKLYLQ